MPLSKSHSDRLTPHTERAHRRDLDGLVSSLIDPDPAARRWAARDLVAFGHKASPALVARLEQETEPSVREAVILSLTEIGDAIAVDGLIQCLRSDDSALRNQAIEALQKLPEAVADRMPSLLSDPDSDVRIFAVNVLESLRHPEVERWLIEVIEQDPHVNVCAAAVDLLGEVGSPASLEALAEVKRRFATEPYLQFAVDLAIQRIQGG